MTCIKPVLDGLPYKAQIEVNICQNISDILVKLKFVAFSTIESILCSTVCIKRPQNENSALSCLPAEMAEIKKDFAKIQT